MSELLTISEVARILHVDPSTTRRWIRQGTLEAIALPRRGARQVYRIRQETLDNLLSGSALVLGEQEIR